ncbi:spherulin-4-like [Clytia hemisphaerica]|uniref:spherulin-4-like n=1 Tax=Clytia hemisphaerica TaxID=252671 RepID=UPI0034D50D4B
MTSKLNEIGNVLANVDQAILTDVLYVGQVLPTVKDQKLGGNGHYPALVVNVIGKVAVPIVLVVNPAVVNAAQHTQAVALNVEPVTSLLAAQQLNQLNPPHHRQNQFRLVEIVFYFLYVYPTNVVTGPNGVKICENDAYKKAAQGGDKVISVVNPNNGKGIANQAVLDEFLACTRVLKDGGNTVLAYVSTEYGTRSETLVKGDIDKWITDFGTELINGFFLDETVSVYETDHIDKYTDYVSYIRQELGDSNAMVIGNAGQGARKNLLETAKMTSVVSYEHPFARMVTNPCLHYPQDSIWCGDAQHPQLDELIELSQQTDFPNSKLSALVYDTASASLNTALDRAVQSYFGLIFVTDAKLAENPWGRLPVYWDDLVDHAYFKKCSK